MTNGTHHRQTLPEAGGFALVATLSVLVLLVLIALAMLSLSTISLRSASLDVAMAEARANARLSLMLAIGQLQQEMGPDARISATSGMLDSNQATAAFDDVAQPHLTGVWPAAPSRVETFGLEQQPPAKVLQSWLISGDPAIVKSENTAKNGYGAGVKTRELVSASTDDPQRRVDVPVIAGEKAGFAWWTSDNGVKATLRAGEKPDADSSSKALLAIHRLEADGHGVLDARIPDRSQGLDGRLLSVSTADVAMSNPPGDTSLARSKLHDLTTHSEIVPVDVTTGTLRKCLNTRLDWMDAQSSSVRKAEGAFGPLGSDASQDYRLFSWDQLRNYQSLARSAGMVTLDPTTQRPQIRTHKQGGFRGTTGEPEWNPTISEDRFRVQPVLLKYSYVVSYATERLTNPADPAKPYALRIYLYPIAVLWNPYNVDLVVPEYCASAFCPLTFNINKDEPGGAIVDLTQKQTATMLSFGPEMGGVRKQPPLVIPAGATQVIYPQEVRWQTHPTEHRHNRFRFHYYIWGEAGEFSLGDNNFGGVVKNLRGVEQTTRFYSISNFEILGAATDPLRIEVVPSNRLHINGTHTDWWGNNGWGTDNIETLHKFGFSTHVVINFEKDGSSPQISLISEDELPQRTFGQLEGKPTPMLYYECYRKPADETLLPSKNGSFSIAGNPIHAHTDKSMGADPVTPWFESAFTFRFNAISSWADVSNTFQLPPDRDDRIYFGNSYSANDGQLNVIDQEIPLAPLVSLAQLQSLPLFDYRPIYDPATSAATTFWYGGDYGFHEGRATQFAQNHAIGNSYASPGIPPDAIHQRGWDHEFNVTARHQRADRSFIANSLLWDAWFCSSVAAQDGLLLQKDLSPRTARQVFVDFLNGTTPLPNDAMVAEPTQSQDTITDLLFDGSGNATEEAYARIAEFLRISGGFNINSVSEDAWVHFLSGLFSRPSLVMESVTGQEAPAVIAPAEDKFLISRYALGNAAPAERASGAEVENRYWNGSREISATQLRELAAAIVVQVKKRGPFTSLSEFVNRRVSTDVSLAVSGALQSALDDPTVSINEPFRSDTITGTESTSAGSPSYEFPDAAKGPRRQGITGYVTQADLLQSLGPLISPRSDTFTIRTLGEARDTNGRVIATAWCEAVVQRNAQYLDPVDAASTPADSLASPINQRFGRRIEVVSFRWLNPDEI